MWITSRVGRGNSLSVLRQIRIHGSRYKIEKIQKLTENFEKACWRSVRIAEERAYLQKYRFLKHCLNVINQYTRKGRLLPQPSLPDQNPHPLSQSIIDKYDLENSKLCLEEAEALLDRGSTRNTQKVTQPMAIISQESGIIESLEEPLEGKELEKQADSKKLDKTDVKKVKNIILKLKQNVNLIERHGNDPDVVGYSKSELEKMIKL